MLSKVIYHDSLALRLARQRFISEQSQICSDVKFTGKSLVTVDHPIIRAGLKFIAKSLNILFEISCLPSRPNMENARRPRHRG